MKESIAVQAFCFSDNRDKLYSFSLFYNELYVTDLKTHRTVSLGKMQAEECDKGLFFQMVYCEEKILLLPSAAKNFYIYDIETGRQLAIPRKKLLKEKEDQYFPYVARKFGKHVYAVNRNHPCVIDFDMEKETWNVLDDRYKAEEWRSGYLLTGNDRLAIISQQLDEFYSFCLKEKKSVKGKVLLEDFFVLCSGVSCFTWIYIPEKKRVCQLDAENFSILQSFEIAFREEEVWPYLLEEGDTIYLFSNKGGEFFCIDLKSGIVNREELKDVEAGVIYHWEDLGEAGVFCGYLTGERNADDYTISRSSVFRYKLLKKGTWEFQDIPIKPETLTDKAYMEKVLQDKRNFYEKAPHVFESEENSLEELTEILRCMSDRETAIRQSNIGEKIYYEMKRRL